MHYAASDSCLSVFCACSFQPICEILIFKRSNLINFAFFFKFNTWSFFSYSELELGHDESAPMPLIQPVICIGLCVFSTLCCQFCTHSKRLRLRVTIRVRDWRRIGIITDYRHLMLLLPFSLSNLFCEEVEEHNSTHRGAAVVDPSEELIGVTNVFLRWYYKLFRQTTPGKTAADTNILRTLSHRYIPIMNNIHIIVIVCIM